MPSDKNSIIKILENNNPTNIELAPIKKLLNDFEEFSKSLAKKQASGRLGTQILFTMGSTAGTRFGLEQLGYACSSWESAVGVAILGIFSSLAGAWTYDKFTSERPTPWDVLEKAIEKMFEKQLGISEIEQFLTQVNKQLGEQIRSEETKKYVRAFTEGVYVGGIGKLREGHAKPFATMVHSVLPHFWGNFVAEGCGAHGIGQAKRQKESKKIILEEGLNRDPAVQNLRRRT